MSDGLYIGLISGTSMDGVDAALVRFESDQPIHVIEALCFPYPDTVRVDLQRAIEHPRQLSALDMARLDSRVGEVFGQAVLSVLSKSGADPETICAVGSHGQTLFHGPDEHPPFSIQIGNPAVIAESTGIGVIADFRAADLAAGGQAAPLAPAIHAAVFGRSGECLAVVNIGGIANVTLLPAELQGPVIGFDTGPGNCLMDDWVSHHQSARYDADGRWAGSGEVHRDLLDRLLDDAYFDRPPPKSSGRETFNPGWLEPRLGDHAPEDVQATLAELTARTIIDGLRWSDSPPRRVLVCGGGVHNAVLMQRLAELAGDVPVASTEEYGLPPDWVEAVLFAWLARRHLLGESGNIPSVTGADREVVLGARYPAPF